MVDVITMRAKVVTGIVLAMLLLVSVLPIGVSFGVVDFNSESRNFMAQSSADWWPMFRHDLRHTGYSTSTAPNTNTTLWSYTTGNDVYSSPAVADGKVFIGSDDNKVYALNATTGAYIWSYTTGANVWSSPAVADGKVYIGSLDKNVYALNATTGAYIWSYTTGHYVFSSPAVADGKVYIGSRDYKVYAFGPPPPIWPMFRHDLRHTGYSTSKAPNTNTTLWSYTTGSSVLSSPAVADGRVYVGSDNGKVYCLDAYTGAFIWSYTTGDYVRSSPAVADGKVYIGSHDNKTYCLNANTGAFIWSYTTGDYVRSSPAVADGKVYIGSHDNKTYCLNANTGAHIWSYTTGDYVRSSPAVADGKVYIGSHDNYTYCLNETTGALVWSYKTGGFVESSPAVADGKVYIGSYDNKVYALNATTGAHIWNYTTGYWVYSSPAVADGKVYIGALRKVYALDATTGAHIWRYTTDGLVRSSPAVADGKVYIGALKKVYALNETTGALVWSYTTGDYVESSPAVADGKVYIGSWDDKVYALDATTGAFIWSYTTGGWVYSSPAVAYGKVYIGSYDRKVYAFGPPPPPPVSVIFPNGTNSSICEYTICDEFTVNITVTNVTDLYAAEIGLTWNPAVLEINTSGPHNGFQFSEAWGTPFVDYLWMSGVINNTAGKIDPGYGAARLYPAPSLNGSMTLAYVDFHVKGYGNSPVHLNVELWDSNNNLIPFVAVDGYIEVHAIRDVAIIDITRHCNKTVIGQGKTMKIHVTAENQGNFTENFNVSAYYQNATGDYLIGTQPVALAAGANTTLTFFWNTAGVKYARYTIMANATVVPGETDTADNILQDPTLVTVTIVGDIDGDGYVYVLDLSLLGGSWRLRHGHPQFNSNADIDCDDYVYVLDLALLGANWRRRVTIDP